MMLQCPRMHREPMVISRAQPNWVRPRITLSPTTIRASAAYVHGFVAP
jgi:hypothetical protein